MMLVTSTPSGRICFIRRGASYTCLSARGMGECPSSSMTQNDFRRLALALDGVVESAHMGHPDFRAHGRIFATIQHDPQRGALMLTPEQQHRLLRDYPGAFT